MKKVIRQDILYRLKPYSERIRYIFLEAYIRSGHAGILDLSENEDLRENLSTYRMFTKSISIYGDKLVFNDCIPWTYGKLKPKHNPHSKAWADIHKHGLSDLKQS